MQLVLSNNKNMSTNNVLDKVKNIIVNVSDISVNDVQKWIGFYVNCSCGFPAMKFIKASGTFETASSPLLSVYFKMSIVMAIYEIVQITRLLGHSSKLLEIGLVSMSIVGYSLFIMGTYNSQVKNTEMAYFLNQLDFKGYQIISEGWQKTSLKNFKMYVVLEVLLSKWAIGVYFSIIWFCTVVIYLFIPGKHRVGAMLDDLELFQEGMLNYKIHLARVINIIQFLYGLPPFFAMVLNIFALALYATRTCFYLAMIRDSDANLQEKVKSYNGLRVLNTLCNDAIIRSFVPSLIYMLIAMGTFALFGFLRQNTDDLANTLTLGGAAFTSFSILTLVLFVFATVWDSSSATLYALRMESLTHKSSYNEKVFASLTPFGVRYGVFKAVKHKHTLDCYDVSLNGVTSLLIAYPI